MKHQTMATALDSLGYDFSTFELSNFVDHLQNLRRREIFIIPWEFTFELFAVWLRVESADYVFYNNQIHSVHQTHSILHELAHIVLGHTCRPITEVLPPKLLAQLSSPDLAVGRTRIILPEFRNGTEECEAEDFVFEIQKRVVAANRLAELTRGSSSIEVLNRYMKPMAFDI